MTVSGHRLSARLLTPPGADEAALCQVLREFGINLSNDGAHDAIVVAGGLEVRRYITDRRGDAYGILSTPVLDQIRAARADGKWIGAPCVALAVVLRALEREVMAGAANRRATHNGVIVFEDLRVISSERPLFGKPADEKIASLRRFAAVLAQRASAASPYQSANSTEGS